MQSNDRDKSNETNETNETNITVDYLNYEESIGSSYSIGYSKKNINNYYNYNNGINERLLLEDKQKSIEKTKTYIFYLICLIICFLAFGVILFAIYYFTQHYIVLYYGACICFIIAVIVSCFLCSCMMYKCNLEKIQGPLISV